MQLSDYSFLVFDWNGTLVNDVHLCHDLLNKMLLERHHPAVSFDTYRDIFTFPIIEYYKKAGFRFSPDGDDDFLLLANEFREDYEKAFPSVPLYSGVKSFLETARNVLPIYLLSATKEELLLAETHEKGVDKLFTDIIGIGDIYGASKQEAAKRYFLNKKLDVSKALFIGDSLHDEEVAISLGGSCCLISNGHQSIKVLKDGKKNQKTVIVPTLGDLQSIFSLKTSKMGEIS